MKQCVNCGNDVKELVKDTPLCKRCFDTYPGPKSERDEIIRMFNLFMEQHPQFKKVGDKP